MAKCRAIFFASAFVAFFCLTFAPSNIFASPSKQCLQCICEASSGCKPNIRCHNTGNGQYFCGPYQISWAYWADAGKPGSTGFSNDFENCLIDKNCAEAAVRGYMAKWGADCDGNGQVDCFDYAAIHKTGPGGCQQQWLLNSKYWSDFKQCYTGSSVNTNRQVFNAPQPPRAAISSSVPLANSQPSFSSSSSFRAIPVGGGNPSDTIIEIPKPLVSRPPGRLSSATSSSSSSTAFGSPSSGPAFASFSSSSSFSRHNSHTEVEISEESSSSNTVSSSTNRIAPPSLPGVTATTTHFAPLRPLQPSFPPLAPPPAPAPVPSITFSSSSSSSLPSLPSYPPVSAPSSPPQANPSRPTTLFQTLPRPPANFNPIVPSDCLECLCQASSKCSKTGCEGAYCGPFLLSWGYWADSGSPGNGANYPSCANNRTCAELAVHGYMNKWNKDCDNDGQITCNDFALIHKLGPHACGKTEAIKDTDYWRRYETCRGEENESSSNDSPLLISSVGSNALQPDLSTANRFAPLPQPPPPPPPKPEIEVEEGPSNPPLVDQPLSRPAPLSTGNAPETIRISFNNREIVNINGNTNRLSQPPSYAVPPATVHSRPLEAEQPLPAISDADDSLAAIPETNDNLNVISNSPLARASPLPAASLYNPAANRNQPQPPPPPPQPSVPTYKPLSSTEAPFVEVRPSSPNTDYYDSPRDSSEGRSSPLSASPSLASQPSEQPSPTSNLPTRSDSLARGRSVGGSNSSSVSNSIVPQDCLECICHASSRCNNNAGCVSDGTGKFICGPYQVDWEYWTEAGKPGQRADLSNLENFQQCLTNRQCADETVRGYMTRFLKDCDENGVRDCNDMAAIHIAGARNCHAQWYLDSQYYADFRSCYDFRRRK